MDPFLCPCGIQFNRLDPPAMCQGCPIIATDVRPSLLQLVAESGPPLFQDSEWGLAEVETRECPARSQLLETDEDIYGSEFGNWGR
jgi:hypothetical protein